MVDIDGYLNKIKDGVFIRPVGIHITKEQFYEIFKNASLHIEAQGYEEFAIYMAIWFTRLINKEEQNKVLKGK